MAWKKKLSLHKMQKLKRRLENKLEQRGEQYNVEDYIDLVREIKSPYHLYIKKDDIGKDTAHFMIYNIGKEKKIVWGIYTNDKFIFLGGCKYKLKNLIKYIDSWRDIDYEFMGNVVKNRTTAILSKYMSIKRKIENHEEYETIYLWYEIKKNKFKKSKLEKYVNKEIKQKVLSRYDEYQSLKKIKGEAVMLELYESDQLETILEHIKYIKKQLLEKVKTDIEKYENEVNLLEKAANSDLINKLYDQIKRKDFGNYDDCEDDIEKCEYSDKFTSPECAVFFHGHDGYDTTLLEPDFL